MTKIEELFKEIEIEKNFEDLHIIRMYSSFVAISNGKIVKITDPFIRFCPLANSLYGGIIPAKNFDSELMKKAIKKAVEKNISEFGFFTERRNLHRKSIAIPYGASEMMMYALKKKVIDSAVVVCDGAGTVIVNKPEVVQGIGARMNGLFYTSPLGKVIDRLKEDDCYVVFPETGDINQVKGVKRAAEFGYKNIAVTVNGYLGENLGKVKEIERYCNISITCLIVCTTGVEEERIEGIRKYGDLVWSCASREIREKVGKEAILQIGTKIPVFVLTKRGFDFIASYSSCEQLIKSLDPEKQYLISGRYKGESIKMDNLNTYLTQAKLPVRSEKEPKPLK